MFQSLTILLSQTKKDWIHTVYGELNEILPPDVAEPLGEYVTLTHYVNANHMHDITTGKSVTDILHLLNQTPIDLYSKKQAAFETATYSSEFVAAHTALSRSLTFNAPSGILVSPSATRVLCLLITRLW